MGARSEEAGGIVCLRGVLRDVGEESVASTMMIMVEDAGRGQAGRACRSS